MKKVSLLDVDFDALTLDQTVNEVVSMIRAGQRGYLSTVNVAILMMMRSDPRLAAFVRGSRFVVADGQPLIWSARMQSTPLPERVAGVDLVNVLAERAAKEGLGIYLMGANRPVIDEVAKRLKERIPGLRIAGVEDGYFKAEQAAERARAIAASKAEILFVGMGVPRQERFLEEYWNQLGVGFAVGVGGSFDVLSGLRSRAPAWMQKCGMEWFYRLIQEPRRLFTRYLVTNTQFTGLMFWSLVTGRHKRPSSGSPSRQP
jgi:N-acetylglucosaminyldiphosphoundecaprenol N-acetyl-beta-D-mannosaminyltransferase